MNASMDASRVSKPRIVNVPAGRYLMGSPKQWKDGQVRRVRVPAVELGVSPVTREQFVPFIAAGGFRDEGTKYWSAAGREWKEYHQIEEPRDWPGQRVFQKYFIVNPDGKTGREVEQLTTDAGDYPALVRWFEAEAYCNWLTATLVSGGETGTYTIPAEAWLEWGFNGGGGWLFPWENIPDPTWASKDFGKKVVAVRERDLNHIEGPFPTEVIYPVGFHSIASPFGLRDYVGSIGEWAQDRYAAYHDPKALDNPTGPAPLEGYVETPGGRQPAWVADTRVVRASTRFNIREDFALTTRTVGSINDLREVHSFRVAFLP